MDFFSMLNGGQPQAAPQQGQAPIQGLSAAEQPAPPPNLQERMAGWSQVFEKLKDPNVARGLLAFSQVTGRAPNVGESAIGQLARGANAGFAAYDTSRWQQDELQRAASRDAREEQKTASDLATAEQARSNSRTQQEETKQRIAGNAALQPLKLEQIQNELATATRIANKAQREERLAALKQNFLEAVNASAEPLDWNKLSPLEKSWVRELEEPALKGDLIKAQTEWYSGRNDASAKGGVGKPPTGAQISFDLLEQTAADLKLTDPEISILPDGPRKDALARLKAQGLTQSKAKMLGNEVVSTTNAQVYIDDYRTNYDSLPEKQRAKKTFEQYVSEQINGIMAPKEFSENPTLKAQIRQGAKAQSQAKPSGTDVLKAQGAATGYNGPVQPMPKTAAEAVDGTVYQTPRGLARWNAGKKKFELLETK